MKFEDKSSNDDTEKPGPRRPRGCFSNKAGCRKRRAGIITIRRKR